MCSEEAMLMGSIAGRPAGKIVLSYEDYVRLPADGKRYELLEGEVYMAPAPSPRHQDVSRNLGRILDGYVRAHRLGKVYYAPIDVVLSRSTVVQPDLIFISGDRLDIVGRHNVAGAPDLVVEILSPATAEYDRTVKPQVYARYGVPHLWLLDPDDQVLEAYELVGGAYVLKERLSQGIFRPSLFPGLEIRLDEVWEE
jgi:Uma2 family endonuclease